MHNKSFAQSNQRARRRLANLPLGQKLDALIMLQQTARDMARAAGRPFLGLVWPGASRLVPPRRV